ANLVGDAPRRDVDQPAAWILGHALGRPLCRRREEGFLHRVLRRREVAVAPHHHAQNIGRQLAEEDRDHSSRSGGTVITCRTSIGMLRGFPPEPGAADAWAAIS